MDAIALQPELLTTDEVARRLNIASQTLSNWRATGRYKADLPFVKIGGAVRYRASDVERALREGIARGPTDSAA